MLSLQQHSDLSRVYPKLDRHEKIEYGLMMDYFTFKLPTTHLWPRLLSYATSDQCLLCSSYRGCSYSMLGQETKTTGTTLKDIREITAFCQPAHFAFYSVCATT